jgi:lysophospholipase L1-like esterase
MQERNVLKNALLVVSSMVLAFALTVGLDRLAGLLEPTRPQTAALIFPPNAEHHFRTREFSYRVRTNSLGFRDREFSVKRGAKFRILALGDSFTFGFGVEVNQSWPKVLEARLRNAGYDVEIANLGRPGASPRDYAAIATRAIPLLKPDLVIVAVLQGDDLAQMAEPPQPYRTAQFAKPDKALAYPGLRRIMSALYPHILAITDEILEPQLFSVWRSGAQSLLASMTPAQKGRFEKLDPAVQQAFMSGQLNPALIKITTSQPDYFLSTMDVTSPKSQYLIQEMADQLTRIGDVARQNQARTIVVSVPYGVYVSRSSFETRRKVGFDVAPEMLTTDAADGPIRRASQIAGLPFSEVTDQFRQASLQHNLFFELDGHFNATGHERFAEFLMPTIERLVTPKTSRRMCCQITQH